MPTVSMITDEAPLLSKIPPAHRRAGTSLTTIEVLADRASTIPAHRARRPARSPADRSAPTPQKPVQIGLFGSPCSNSTHTPAPIGGTR